MLRSFFTLRGRISRGTFTWKLVAAVLVLGALHLLVESAVGPRASVVVLPALYWSVLSLCVRRYHDVGFSGLRLAWVGVPILGLAGVTLELFFRSGTDGENRYGPKPRYHGLRHYEVKGRDNVVDDVTKLNPVEVAAVVTPRTVAEVQAALQESSVPVSVGGGRFSMGGHTASPGSMHLDMRRLNRIVEINVSERRIVVEAGARWCDVQRAIDPLNLSVKTMQTYANFTVGGSVSVNCHGRYVGLGPIVLSVRSLSVVLADGRLVRCSRDAQPELFFGLVGGYGALGVIVEVELELDENSRVRRSSTRMEAASYWSFFKQSVRTSRDAVFHNADLYPPHFSRLRAVTWSKTDAFVTKPARLMRVEPSHLAYRYLFWAVSESPLGKWRREHLHEPLFYLGETVHWRNYEAGYDVAELEPASRKQKTFVLQEYFVPVEQFDAFKDAMAHVFQRYDVNVVNVSIRHAIADDGTLLAWADTEVFAFVIYYKQAVDACAQNKVAIWTRRLIDAAVACGGRYYLPYQIHATQAQFHRCYPGARRLFALKEELDPKFRFRGRLWDTYYAPTLEETTEAQRGGTLARVFSDTVWSDRFFEFLRTVYRIYPEDRLHHLIRQSVQAHEDDDGDEPIYRTMVRELPSIRSPLDPVRYALPALAKQKEEMAKQTLELLDETRTIRGYVEIGSTGRYASALGKHVEFVGTRYFVSDQPPTNAPPDIAERGGLSKLGPFFPLGDYEPLPAEIPDGSVDLVTCYIGLHHAPRERLDAFVSSIRRVLKPGGSFILRDHDVCDDAMDDFVAAVHTIFNAGLLEPWEVNAAELRFFWSVADAVQYLESRGFQDQGARLLQPNDPTQNVLMAFTKAEPS
ncbi:MAG: FAD-binding protein [Myxococcota bacterium]